MILWEGHLFFQWIHGPTSSRSRAIASTGTSPMHCTAYCKVHRAASNEGKKPFPTKLWSVFVIYYRGKSKNEGTILFPTKSVWFCLLSSGGELKKKSAQKQVGAHECTTRLVFVLRNRVNISKCNCDIYITERYHDPVHAHRKIFKSSSSSYL